MPCRGSGNRTPSDCQTEFRDHLETNRAEGCANGEGVVPLPRKSGNPVSQSWERRQLPPDSRQPNRLLPDRGPEDQPNAAQRPPGRSIAAAVLWRTYTDFRNVPGRLPRLDPATGFPAGAAPGLMAGKTGSGAGCRTQAGATITPDTPVRFIAERLAPVERAVPVSSEPGGPAGRNLTGGNNHYF